MAIFLDMVENIIKVFVDDFSIYDSSFDVNLINLSRVLKRYEKSNLILNWEKCHFMIHERVALGHRILEKGIEVDKVKIEIIERLPPPNSVRDIRNFFRHVGFYRRFIKDFSR